MVDPWYCLDRVVPEGMIQGWRRSEVGNYEQRALNTRLSSGTSVHTSSSSRNVPGRMILSDLFWYWNKIKIKPIGTRRFRINFSEGSGPHLRFRTTSSTVFATQEGKKERYPVQTGRELRSYLHAFCKHAQGIFLSESFRVQSVRWKMPFNG